ncbi:hypothetical protein BT96DRAFT_992363 [Gymnopus androsaceus JB14]|uniref:Uncharacterized protein n=1 Tax=Gymnopus androsaceus JB14 TaxID=1447944 RepID=A0A6A4HTV0_9AGAR|nr:hypothetical protein BT96DRAFT_992363 [Gymnopus androsaceus JB14]
MVVVKEHGGSREEDSEDGGEDEDDVIPIPKAHGCGLLSTILVSQLDFSTPYSSIRAVRVYPAHGPCEPPSIALFGTVRLGSFGKEGSLEVSEKGNSRRATEESEGEGIRKGMKNITYHSHAMSATANLFELDVISLPNKMDYVLYVVPVHSLNFLRFYPAQFLILILNIGPTSSPRRPNII